MRLFLLTALAMAAFAANSVLNRMAVGRGWIGPLEFALVRLLAGAAMLALVLGVRVALRRGVVWPGIAGLLAGVRAQLVPRANVNVEVIALAAFAVASVAWWYVGQLSGDGDLRPYLMLQIAPLVLIPLWQTVYGANRADRLWFGVALVLYVLAKIAELHDHEIHAMLGWITGHTLKHVLASAAAWVLVARLIRSTSSAPKLDDVRASYGKPTAGCASTRFATLTKSLSNVANRSL